MIKTFVTALAAGLLAGSALIASSDAEARQQSGGGRSGGGHASFAASAGGARVAARATGGNAAHFRASAAGFSFSAGARAPAAFVGVNTGRVQHQHRSHGRRYGFYAAAIGIPLISYAYVSNSYRSCAWLKERYEDSGLRKWRLRYEACIDGDDD